MTAQSKKSSELPNTSLAQLLINIRWAFNLAWSHHKSHLLKIICLSLFQSVLPAGLAVAARELINSISSNLDGVNTGNQSLWFWLALSLVLTLLLTIANLVYSYYLERLRDDLDLHISTKVLEHTNSLHFAFFENPANQDMLQRARGETAGNFAYFIQMNLGIASKATQVVALFFILIYIDPLIVPILIPIGLIYLAFRWVLARDDFLEKHARANRQRWINYYVEQLTLPIRVAEIKLLNLSGLLLERFRKAKIEFRDRNRELDLRAFWSDTAFSVFSVLVVYLIFLRVIFQIIEGQLTIGDVALYAGVTARVRPVLQSVISNISKVRTITFHISDLRTYLNAQSAIRDTGDFQPENTFGELELRNVSFAYAEDQALVLSNISLKIKPGETIALVGENGAGKTTLVKLIARLYEIDQGEILFDQTDIRKFPVTFWKQQISLVFQDFGAYEATALENIAFGDWERLLDQPELVKEKARATGVDQLIESAPDGYDTLLGRRFGEYSLSGGQWQQIAITRALAREAKLLILDEPTANLDVRSEYELFSRFKQLTEEQTTILISHRFSTVRMADRILVMENGQITEQGTHDELIQSNGLYAELYDLHARQSGIAALDYTERAVAS